MQTQAIIVPPTCFSDELELLVAHKQIISFSITLVEVNLCSWAFVVHLCISLWFQSGLLIMMSGFHHYGIILWYSPNICFLKVFFKCWLIIPSFLPCGSLLVMFLTIVFVFFFTPLTMFLFQDILNCCTGYARCFCKGCDWFSIFYPLPA